MKLKLIYIFSILTILFFIPANTVRAQTNSVSVPDSVGSKTGVIQDVSAEKTGKPKLN